MSNFNLLLQDISNQWQSNNIHSFIGQDSSGSFGIMAEHELFVTCLQPGIARFRDGDGKWTYLAQPGSVIVFRENQLRLSTSQFILSEEHGLLVQKMETLWRDIYQNMNSSKRITTQMEHALARKLADVNRTGAPL